MPRDGEGGRMGGTREGAGTSLLSLLKVGAGMGSPLPILRVEEQTEKANREDFLPPYDHGVGWGVLSGLERVELCALCWVLSRRLGEGSGSPSSALAWRILWTEEPGGLPSMRSHSRAGLKPLSVHARVGEGSGSPSSALAGRSPGTGEPGGLPSGVAQGRTP